MSGRPYIKCLKCGLTSYHPRDIGERFCGKCHAWHDPDAAERTFEVGEKPKEEGGEPVKPPLNDAAIDVIAMAMLARKQLRASGVMVIALHQGEPMAAASYDEEAWDIVRANVEMLNALTTILESQRRAVHELRENAQPEEKQDE